MKDVKIIFSTACLFLFLVSCSEQRVTPADVPAAVTSAFNTKYPGAKDVEWEKETENNQTIYEVEFKTAGKEYKAKYDANGKVLSEQED